MFSAVNQLETVDWLARTLGSGVPFAAVTGELGVGKTTVVALAAARLSEAGHLVIRAEPPFAGPLELQALLAERLGLAAGTRTTPALVAAALRDRRSPSGGVVLLIDGAEHIPPTVLQYLWLMHRLSGLGGPRLQTVFVGRFAFWERFADPELNDLRSEIAARFVVLPLRPEESLAYVRHRLSAAAGLASIGRRQLREIVAEGRGIPLRLNAATDAALSRATPAPTPLLPAIPRWDWMPARRGARTVAGLAGLVAIAALSVAVLLPKRAPIAPLRIAALPPRVAVPTPPPPTSPPPKSPPPTSPPPTAPLRTPPPPTPSPPAAQPVAAAPLPALSPTPKPVLPGVAMLRVTLEYPAAEPSAAARAGTVATQLRGRGFLVDDPVAIAGTPHATTVEYYFAQDREQAEQLARDLGGSAGLGPIGGPREPPPPGTVRIVLANTTVTIARSP